MGFHHFQCVFMKNWVDKSKIKSDQSSRRRFKWVTRALRKFSHIRTHHKSTSIAKFWRGMHSWRLPKHKAPAQLSLPRKQALIESSFTSPHPSFNPTSMAPPRIPRNRNARQQLAIEEYLAGRMSVRDAGDYFGIPYTTVQYGAKRTAQGRVAKAPGHPPALSSVEENLVLGLLRDYATNGIPMDALHVCQAVQVLVQRMPATRQKQLSFHNGRPGRKWIRRFVKRHNAEIKFTRPTKQEAQRFAACSGEVLATHFARVEKIIREHNLDADRMWNLDECGVTPGKDINSQSRSKRIMPRSTSQDIKVPHFSYDKRITLMPTISSSGQTGPCLFVFKGKRVPYRNVWQNGTIVSETPINFLPRGSVAALREVCGGVDSMNFRNWAAQFVRSVSDLTAGNRKVLLVYDAYRSHLSLDVLLMFLQNNMIVHALPAHTSGKTQPLDVVVFGVFKRELNKVMGTLGQKQGEERWDVFKLCMLIRHAYEVSFTGSNIKSAFKRAGLWPLDITQLLSVPRPAGPNDLSTILSNDQLEQLLEKKRALMREKVLGEEGVLHSSGFVDSTCGEVMTSTNALRLIQAHANRQKTVRASAKVEAKKKELEEQRKRVARGKKKALLHGFVDLRRAALCKERAETYRKHVRPLEERRAIVKLNATRRAQQR